MRNAERHPMCFTICRPQPPIHFFSSETLNASYLNKKKCSQCTFFAAERGREKPDWNIRFNLRSVPRLAVDAIHEALRFGVQPNMKAERGERTRRANDGISRRALCSARMRKVAITKSYYSNLQRAAHLNECRENKQQAAF